MLLSHPVALSILAALTANAMVIPNVGDVIDVFKTQDKNNALAELKNGIQEAIHHAGDALSSAISTIAEYEQMLAGSDTLAPLMDNQADTIAHKYMVVFKDNVPKETIDFHQLFVASKHAEDVSLASPSDPYFASIAENNGKDGIFDKFEIGNLQGYAGYFLDSTLDWIRRDPSVDYVEIDSVVRANEHTVQNGAPWGLARISHRPSLSLGTFSKYVYDDEGGDGVTAYVVDTGVYIKHKQFEGRAKWGATIPTDDADVDGNGHGTHCAGTIASKDYGVAKKANVVGVKVLKSNGSGSMLDVVKGVNFVLTSHKKAISAAAKGFRGSTANLSLGGGKSPTLDKAVNAAVAGGIHFAVAAGNENQDAGNTSPASAELAVTVGASTIADAKAYFSNYGKTVDIWAPGLNILSTYIGSETATATLSGTSMASPHICGLLSYYVSLQPGAGSEFFAAGKGVTPAQLKKNLVSFASKGLLSDIPSDGTPNLLAFNGAGNLTDFWAGSSSNFESESEFEIDAEVTDLMEKLEEKAEDFVEEIKHMVSGIYGRE